MKSDKVILLIFFLCAAFYPACDKKPPSRIELKISSLKQRYILGEEVYIKFTLENNGTNIDSIINFDDGSLAFDAEIRNDASIPISYEGTSVGNISYTKINPGETKEVISCVSAFRGPEGSPLFAYFPLGKYKMRGVIKHEKYGIIKSNTINYVIEKPDGTEETEFVDFQYFVNYDNQFRKRIKTREDNIALTDKAIEFLYKHPNSVFTGRILVQNFHDRRYGKYKYDYRLLDDVEYYISINPYSPVNRSLIYLSLDLSENLGGTNYSDAFLLRLSSKCGNENINKLIEQIKSEQRK